MFGRANSLSPASLFDLRKTRGASASARSSAAAVVQAAPSAHPQTPAFCRCNEPIVSRSIIWMRTTATISRIAVGRPRGTNSRTESPTASSVSHGAKSAVRRVQQHRQSAASAATARRAQVERCPVVCEANRTRIIDRVVLRRPACASRAPTPDGFGRHGMLPEPRAKRINHADPHCLLIRSSRKPMVACGGIRRRFLQPLLAFAANPVTSLAQLHPINVIATAGGRFLDRPCSPAARYSAIKNR